MKKNKEIAKEFTWEDLFRAHDDERRRVAHILTYILNKHSRPGEIDYKRAFEEIETFTSDLFQ